MYINLDVMMVRKRFSKKINQNNAYTIRQAKRPNKRRTAKPPTTPPTTGPTAILLLFEGLPVDSAGIVVGDCDGVEER